jgi:hypothetical protein
MTAREATISGFALLLGLALAMDVRARRPSSHLSTAAAYLGALMRPTWGRWLVLLGWLWLGWHFFAR